MADYRKSMAAGGVVIACGWLLLIWLLSGTSTASGVAQSELQSGVAESVRLSGPLLVLILTILLYPNVIARPFAIAEFSSLSGDETRAARRLTLLYYCVVVVFGSTVVSMYLTFPDLPAAEAFDTEMRSLALPAATLSVAAILYFTARKFHFHLIRRDLEIWLLFLTVSTVQVLAVGWIDVSSRPRAVVALLALPTSALLFGQLGRQADNGRVQALLVVVLLLVSAGVASFMLILPGWWQLVSFAAACLLWLVLFGLAGFHTRRLGFANRLYRRYRIGYDFSLESASDRVVSSIESTLGHQVARVVGPILHVLLVVASVLARIFVTMGNVALLVALVTVDIIVRMPESIGGSLVRLKHALNFYLDLVIMPIAGFASMGFALLIVVAGSAVYLVSAPLRLSIALTVAFALVLLSMFVGLGALYRLPIREVASLYLKPNQPADDSRPTPITYFTYLLFMFWVVQLIGMIVTRFVALEAAPLFYPGYLFAAESLVIGGTVITLFVLSRRRP